MKLIVVRHGETEENLKDLVQGQNLGTLSEKGREQSRHLAQRLLDEKIDAVFSSDLKRAKQTTQEIVKFHPKVPVHYTPLLRERNLSTFEGRSVVEFRAARDTSGLPKHLYRPPGGESYQDIAERVKKFLTRVTEKCRNKTVLAVTHSGFIKILISVVLNKPLQEMREFEPVPNTCITILELKSDHRFEVKVLGSVDHLEGSEQS